MLKFTEERQSRQRLSIPSAQRIKISRNPRFLREFKTPSQYFALSFSRISMPKTSLHRIDFFERTRLPLMDLLQNIIGNIAYKAVGNLKAIEFLDCVGNLTCAQAASVHRDDFSVNAGNILLPFWKNLRCEGRFPILRHFHTEIIIAGIYTFGFVPFAGVVRIGAF